MPRITRKFTGFWHSALCKIFFHFAKQKTQVKSSQLPFAVSRSEVEKSRLLRRITKNKSRFTQRNGTPKNMQCISLNHSKIDTHETSFLRDNFLPEKAFLAYSRPHAKTNFDRN